MPLPEIRFATMTKNFSALPRSRGIFPNAFRRLKNFACVEIHPQNGQILAYVKVDPSSVVIEPGFTKDMTNIGHYGTGDLEIRIKSNAELEKAKPLVLKSYEDS